MMSFQQTEIIILAALTAITCALPGVFLILRRMSLMSDAISHAILLGIILAFFYTKDLSSPILLIGATVVGVITVTLTEIVIKTRKLKEDAAIGLIFPFLFSVGVILINRYTSDVHIDAECVLFGEIAFAPFNRFYINGHDFGPKGIWVMTVILILNIIFINVFYKELKIATFDPGLAATLGFFPGLLHYSLMTLVSITAVGAFENVGSILVVALMIAPPSAAYLLTDRLSKMLFLSAGIGMLSALLGYAMAFHFDVSIAGSMSTMSGIIFFLVLIFAPEKGILAKLVVKKWERWSFPIDTLTVHLLQAELTHAAETERIVNHMTEHMLWTNEYTSAVIAQCLEEGLIEKNGDKLILTVYGREKAKTALAKA